MFYILNDILELIIPFIDSYQTINNLMVILDKEQKKIIIGSKIWIYNKPKIYTDTFLHYIKYMNFHCLDLTKTDTLHFHHIFNTFVHKSIHTIKFKKKSNIVDDDLKLIQNVKSLYLGDNSLITDHGIQCLGSVRVLFLCSNSKITDNGIIGISDNLNKLYLGNNSKLTDKSMHFLRNIESLALGDNSKITDQGIIDLIDKNYVIKYLKIGKNPKITMKSVSKLKNIPNVCFCDKLLQPLSNELFLNERKPIKITNNIYQSVRSGYDKQFKNERRNY